MKYSNVILIIIMVLLMIICPMFFATDINTKVAQENTKYTSYVRSATKAGLSAVTAEGMTNKDTLFSTEASRQDAVKSYYDTLVKCFNYENTTSEDMVKYYTPCLFLIDTDGFYIESTETYQAASDEAQGGSAAYTDVISPENKWTAKYGDYLVEFHLDDSVHVIYNNQEYSGDYQEMYKKFSGSGYPDSLKIVDSSSPLPNFAETNRDTFAQQKTDYIVSKLQEKLEYCVNSHQEFFNKQNAQYEFTLPKISGDDWGDILDNPTMLGFLQGKQVDYTDKYLNIYSFSGKKLDEDIDYYLVYDQTDKCYYYHTEEHMKQLFSGSITESDPNFLDENFKKTSMDKAAKSGAYPCPECVKKKR